MAVGGSGVGWGDVNFDGTPDMEGESQETSHQNLLISGCVGCHSSTTSSTIIEVGTNDIPIVFNTNGYPTDPLAGGNFYWVSQGTTTYDGYGHNVFGISEPDSHHLTSAPGNTRCSGDATSCHHTLAAAPDFDNDGRGGCQGCHYEVFHHVDNANYRFLNSHDYNTGAYVTGVEAANWEQDTSLEVNRNKYKGVNATSGSNLKTTKSITAYCGGCHANFHGIGSTSSNDAWIRHPSDILLPDSGEYAAYDPTTTYNNYAPVGWVDPSTPTRASAVVTCLSCHRPHGSDQPDMLRWDYDACTTGTGSAVDCGCFVCHTEKDA